MDQDKSNVCLKVNGKEVPLNPFVTLVFFNVINGLVDSLDKIPEDKTKIEISIE
jgi:hypothetical protein